MTQWHMQCVGVVCVHASLSPTMYQLLPIA